MLSGYTFPWQGAVLVGFSGGPDSRLLLHLLAAERDRTGRAVYAAHLNHGIRGDEADRDEAFCVATAKEYDIPLFVRHVDIPALCAVSGRSLELEARLCRYRFFEDVMAEHRIPLLATAHNADDQLETILLRLLRGTGTRGLGGIPRSRPLPSGGMVVRPLLDCTKADILAACEKGGLSYVLDRTNLEDDCTRNRIRHHILPELEKIAGDGVPQQAAVRLSEHMQEDEEALQAFAGKTSMELSALRSVPTAIAKRAILRGYTEFSQEERLSNTSGAHDLTTAHLNALLSLCQAGEAHSLLDLPGGVQAVIEQNRLCFQSTSDHLPPPTSLPHPVPLREGITLWDEGGMTIELKTVRLPYQPPSDPDVFARALFPPLDGRVLYARYRECGDVIRSHGMTKKLKKLICDKKIPLELRDRLPLICLGKDGQDPLWFPGVAFRDGFPAPIDKEAVQITVSVHKKNIRQNKDT